MDDVGTFGDYQPPILGTTKDAPLIKNPKAAVIIFHKNVESYPEQWIKKCIDSIQNQTYQHFDVFEIDYGGGGKQIYPGSNVFIAKFNNHAEAHNFLLDMVFAIGYDCAFNVNIDDVYELNRFEKQIPYMQAGFDIVSSNYYNIDENGNVIRSMQMDDKNPDIESSNNHNIIAHPVVCYSRNFWTTCSRLLPEEIPRDDFELWKRSYKNSNYKFIVLPDYLLHYRVHENKISKEI